MKYEVVVILDPKSDEEKIDGVISRYEEYLNKNNGKFTSAEKWGKRDLQVQFKKYDEVMEGHYVMIQFDDPKKNIAKLNYQMKIDSDIIRHLVSKV